MATVIDAVLNLKDQFTPILKQTQSAINNTKTAASSFTSSVKSSFSQATSAVNNHNNAHKRMQKSLADTGKSFSDLGTKVLIGAAALIALTKEAAKANIELDKNVAKLNSLSGANGMSRAEMEKTKTIMFTMANQFGMNVETISQGYITARKEGVEFANIQTHMAASIRLTKLSGMELTESIKDLQTMTKSWYLTQGDQIALQDQLIVAQTQSKHGLDELIPAYASLSKDADRSGVSFTNLAASMGVMTGDMNVTVPQTQAAFSSLFEVLNGGSPKALKAAAEYGIDLADAQEQIKAVGLEGYLKSLAEATGGDQAALKKITGSVDMAQYAMKLYAEGTGNVVAKQKELEKAAGTAGEALGRMGDTPAAKFAKASAKMHNAMQQAFTSFMPYMTQAAELVTLLINKWEALDPATRDTILKAVASIGMLLISFVAVGKAIGIVANAWKGFTLLLNSKAFSLIIKALKGIIGFLPTIGRLFLSVGSAIIGVIKAIALAFIHNPILLAIAAVIAILYLLWRNWDTVCAWVKNKWDWLGKAIESGVENIKSFIKGIVDWITNTFTSLWSDAWDNICSIFGDKFSGLRNIVAPIFNWICEKLDYIVAKYNEIKDQNAQTANTSTMSYLNPFGHNAAGTDNWRGGLTYINEDNKGEIVDLPRGTKIYPHDESVAMARREGKGGISVMIPKLADQIIVRQDSDIDRITDALVFKLKGMAINRMEGAV